MSDAPYDLDNPPPVGEIIPRLTREEFDKLEPAERLTFTRDGGEVFDADAADDDGEDAAAALVNGWLAPLAAINPADVPARWSREQVNEAHGRMSLAAYQLAQVRDQLEAKLRAAGEYNDEKKRTLTREAQEAAAESARNLLSQALEAAKETAGQDVLHDEEMERLTATFHPDEAKALALEQLWAGRVARATPAALQRYGVLAVSTRNLALANVIEMEVQRRGLNQGDAYRIVSLCRAVGRGGAAAGSPKALLGEIAAVAERGCATARDIARKTGDSRLAMLTSQFEADQRRRS